MSKTSSVAQQAAVAGFEVFCGIDVARETHHAVALDPAGERLVDRPLPNAEPDLVGLFDELQAHGRVLVVVDQLASIGALAIAVARSRGIAVAYLPGLAMRRIADLYPGEAKTDARDAYVIADAARTLPHALRRVGPEEQTTVELAVLAGYDADLAAEATRLTNRLHDALLHVHPALERLLGKHFRRPGVLRLLAATGTPAAIAALGPDGIKGLIADGLTADGRHPAGPDPHRAGRADRDDPGHRAVRPGHPRARRPAAVGPGPARRRWPRELEELLATHPLAEILTSMPGVGPRTAIEGLGRSRNTRARADSFGGTSSTCSPAAKKPGRDVPPDPVAALHGPRPLRPVPDLGQHRGETLDIGGEPATAEHGLIRSHHLDRDAALVRVHPDHDPAFLDLHHALPSPRTSQLVERGGHRYFRQRNPFFSLSGPAVPEPAHAR